MNISINKIVHAFDSKQYNIAMKITFNDKSMENYFWNNMRIDW